MRKKFKKYVFYCFLFTGALAFGQKQNKYTFYRQNMNILNPAYAGSEFNTSIVQTARTQWLGVEDAPFSQSFSFGTWTSKNVGLGLSVENDRTFIERTTWINVDFSFKITLEKSVLFMGIKAGGQFYDLNTERARSTDLHIDPSLKELHIFNPNIGMGFLLKHKKYYFSLSAPAIVETRRTEISNKKITMAAENFPIFLSSGYDVQLNESISLKPSFLLRYTDNKPLSVEFTTLMDLDEKIGLGVAYNTNKTMSGLAIMDIFSWLRFGYSYQYSLQRNLQKTNKGTHEVLLKFIL